MESTQVIMGVFLAAIIVGTPLVIYLVEKENKH